MAGVSKKHLVDGRWTTVNEVAQEFGLKPQQIYQQMRHKHCSLQVVVWMIRENLILGDQGRASRYMVDGKWMTIRQAAEILGITKGALCDYLFRHPNPDGSPCRLADAVEAYRQHQVRIGGKRPVQHKVGRKTMTTFEAAEMLGVDVKTLRLYMSRHKASLAATIRYYEKRKLKQAEKDILAILREGQA